MYGKLWCFIKVENVPTKKDMIKMVNVNLCSLLIHAGVSRKYRYISNLGVSATLDSSECSNHDIDWQKNPNGPQHQ
jgi:hypothetical protein